MEPERRTEFGTYVRLEPDGAADAMMVVVEDFVVARNPDGDSALPYLVRLPLGPHGVVLKVRDTWPRTAKVYCHPSQDWDDSIEVVERVPVRSCVRRGAAIDLVLDRGRENRSQFVFTRARGCEVIFWQSARTAKQARPAVSTPTRRASGLVLEILVDSHERYPWKFSAQQATTRRQALPAGDYAVEHGGRIVAAVERRSLAEAQVRFPGAPIVFCQTRPLAQEWTSRFLGAALAHHAEDAPAADRADALPAAGPLAPAAQTAAEIRAWANANGHEISAKGRIPASVREAFNAAT